MAVAAVAYLLDQWSKAWASARLGNGQTIDVIGSWLRLYLTHNPGAAFSTGTNYTVVFSCIAVVATVVVCFFVVKVRDRWWAVGLGCLLAGVAGNLTDRLVRPPGPFRGHVVDFIALPHWPVFNVADMCINAAAGLIVVQTIRGVRVDGSPDRDGRDRARDDSGTRGE